MDNGARQSLEIQQDAENIDEPDGIRTRGSKIAAVVLSAALCAIGRRMTRKESNIFLALNRPASSRRSTTRRVLSLGATPRSRAFARLYARGLRGIVALRRARHLPVFFSFTDEC